MNIFDRFIGRKNAQGKLELAPDPLQMKMLSKAEQAEQGFAALQASVDAESEKWNAKLERMESDEAQGGAVNEDEMKDVRDRAMAYGNMKAAFAGSEKTPPAERIRHAIAFLETYAPQSPESQRATMLGLIDRLRGL